MLPRLQLHSLHIHPHSVSSIPSSGDTAGLRLYKTETSKMPVVVWTTPSCLRIQSSADDAVPIVEVPLMLAEVKQDWDSTSGQMVVIVKPWCEAEHVLSFDEITFEGLKNNASATARDDKASLAAHVNQHIDGGCGRPEFWIFLVEGGGADADVAVRKMGEVGSIRSKPADILEVGKQVGAGANANVYIAKYKHRDDVSNPESADNMVLKVLNPNADCATAREEFDGIQHEITLVVHAGRHPNIVKYFGVFSLGSKDENLSRECNWLPPSASSNGVRPRWALLSDYMPGGDVFDAVAECRFKEARARQVTADLLSALTHIHRRGIVHRDVKPENILLGKDGRAVLTDFGIAALISDEEAMQKCCGSPGYIAPEILSKKPCGIKVDSFGAGAVLYFMVCGKLPFDGGKVDSVLRRTLRCEVSFDQHAEFFDVTSNCKAFILKLLQKDPSNRLSAEQAASQLWCVNDHKDNEYNKGGNISHTCKSSRGHNSVDVNIHDVNNMSEQQFADNYMTCEFHTARGVGEGGLGGCGSDGGLFHCQPSCSSHMRDDGCTREEDFYSILDKGLVTESSGQRSSGQGTWSRRLNQLVSKFRTGKSDGSGSHRADITTNTGRDATPRGKYKVCEREAKLNPHAGDRFALWESDFCDEERSTAAPTEDYSTSYRPSAPSSSAGSAHSRRLQALKSAAKLPQKNPGEMTGSRPVLGTVMEPVPPASPPENPRPRRANTRARQSSKRETKDHESTASRNGKGASNQPMSSEDSASSSPKVLLNDGQEMDRARHGEIREPASPRVDSSARPAQRRFRKARPSSAAPSTHQS